MKREIKVNAIYRHFKGMMVKVIAIAKDSEDLSKKVVYQHVDNPSEVWVRDYDMFLSLVDYEKYPDITQEYRFEEVREEN